VWLVYVLFWQLWTPKECKSCKVKSK
jgi:hypothetical protein